jgi:exodeoxyribonuclease VII small subunit
MTRKPVRDKDDASLPFEGLLEQLTGIVATLETGSMSLEDSLLAYERGVALVRMAGERLQAMDQKLEQLTEQGRIVALTLTNNDDKSDAAS